MDGRLREEPSMIAWRSMASVSARRTRASENGARAVFQEMKV